MSKKLHSLKAKTLAALLICGFVSIVFYLILDYVVSAALISFLENSTFTIRQNEKYLTRFENMVKEDSLSTTSADRFDEWVDSNVNLFLAVQIEKEGTICYDSAGLAVEEEVEQYHLMSMYTDVSCREIAFSDGKAMVYLTGYYVYVLYNRAFGAEILLSVLVFLSSFMFFLKRKIRDIMRLLNDIKILETGGLEHEITVRGQDELSELAVGLEHMRLALKETMQKKEEAAEANHSLVVSVAHDLRTPLTALLLYLDLMKQEKISEADRKLYLEKSKTKAVQIKTMTDDLFERFLVARSAPPEYEPVQTARTAFEDSLSEFVGSLSEQGFEVEASVEWPNLKVRLMSGYLVRILDNVMSNLLKYADHNKPVRLSVCGEKKGISLSFSNYTGADRIQKDSSHVGVANIRLMMERMEGKCLVRQTADFYEIALFFPGISSINN